MARGNVVEWDGASGSIGERATADRVRFASQSLQVLLPGDVHVGLEVEFDRVDETGKPPTARNVRRPSDQPNPLKPALSGHGFDVGLSGQISPGDIVAGLEPDEHVEITKVTPFGPRTLVEGVGVTTRRVVRRPLGPDELGRVQRVRGSDHTYDGDPRAFLLGVEAHRIKTAYQFDPLFAVNSSAVDVLPHQVEAVYRYLLPLPRIRFLLADDTGAGKTIMAGLILKELLFRGTISKVLIVVPGGLTRQWVDEMAEKFGLNFRLINRVSFEAEPAQFARSDDGLFVTSIDFIARHDGCLNAARETQWDMVIVDEAHKLSAYEYGIKVDRSERYQAVEALAPRTDHLLFLTATPHRGRRDTFRRLLMLLDEDLFQEDELVTQRINRSAPAQEGEAFESEAAIARARNRFFLRRLKEEMVGWDSQPLFRPRYAKTVGYELTPEELDLYTAVTQYVRSRRKEAKAKKNRNVELILMVMQRRLASSIYAITCTLRNRLGALDEVIRILRDPTPSAAEKKRLLKGDTDDVPGSYTEYEDLDERQRDAVERKVFRQVLSDDPEQVEKERGEVAELLRMAEALNKANHKEAKFAELLKVLDSSDVIRRENEKLVIFTEHKDTMNNLTERLVQRGYTVANIHGGMDVDARKEAQRIFRTEKKILVCTDAAGEGINLQFCRFLLNWDIPWNPNRLEQRMGRVHRYGQTEVVQVFNLVASNTREGAVLERILSKLDIMREQLGDDRVYDVVDELLEQVPLLSLIEKSIDAPSKDTADEVANEAERLMTDPALKAKAEELVSLQKKKSLASKLNLADARRLRDASDERRLQPLFMQNFFLAAYREAGGTVRADDHFPVYHVGTVPSAVLDVARSVRLPVRDKYDTPFVFDKTLVSVASKTRVPEHTKLLGSGHPLFEALTEWAIRKARDSFARGATLCDPNIATPQKLWLVRSAIEDGRQEARKRLAHQQMSVVLADHHGLRSVSPATLLNFTVPDGQTPKPALADRSSEEIQMWAFDAVTDPQLKQVEAHRRAECDLRRQYLDTTFTDLISELSMKVEGLQAASLFGNDDPEERDKLEKRLRELKIRKQRRLEELELMLRLTANLPDVVTSALVVPSPVATMDPVEPPATGGGFPMRRDDEVERIAMEVVMKYERARGWTPFDVSQDGEHYDIRSEGPEAAKRFIEVKGRAQTGGVVLTAPEVDKLRQLGDRAFLYIVTFCKGERPKLRIIQDPMANLHPAMLYRQVQYFVDESDWKKHGEDHDCQ
ncbi:helicase-related protein [Frigoriglobus tundricola]|uniref:Helicase domain-containing protein n=1 Tax=Frigoriglobus tundricola TaxID=2774151 RepID=A0A6M5YTQ0_9BACT|nr:helicase-related protein [Frigoriglobus tundricola]QJW97249.1 helicase domain-containing protein [Frigoriglobus tundricola]